MLGGGMTESHSMMPEQDHRIAVAAVAIVKRPLAFGIKADQRLDPSLAIEIGPLVGKAQVDLDDTAADRFEVHHAGISCEVVSEPLAEIALEIAAPSGMDRPVIEGSIDEGLARGMTPPLRPALDDRAVARHMLALEERHPHMAGAILRIVVSAVSQ